MGTALIVIDMQMGMQARLDEGRAAMNPDAATVIGRLAAACRAAGVPVFHVHHHDTHPDSPFRAGAPDAAPMPACAPVAGDAVVIKSTSSAFASTDLAAQLRARGIERLIVTGAVLGFCVTSTVRAAADLGFQVMLVRDACLGFDLPIAGLDAAQIAAVTFGLLGADFATLCDTDTLIATL